VPQEGTNCASRLVPNCLDSLGISVICEPFCIDASAFVCGDRPTRTCRRGRLGGTAIAAGFNCSFHGLASGSGVLRFQKNACGGDMGLGAYPAISLAAARIAAADLVSS
jgi:hypothetical protein